MTRKWFGTDGVRGVANRSPMRAEDALLLGRAIGRHWAAVDGQRSVRPQVVIGRDTRASGDMLEAALVAGLCSAGVDALLAGVMPTPAIAHLTLATGARAGVVISASHNPFEDNGIKVFGADGYKLPDAEEAALEALVGELDWVGPVGVGVGRASVLEGGARQYVDFVQAVLGNEPVLTGRKIVVDCAHGAMHEVAPLALMRAGAQVITVGAQPDGTNINDGVGALHPESLALQVKHHQADFGVALDGDGDRCILVDEAGQVVDGDQVLALLALDLARQGCLRGTKIVATVMSNLGLDRALKAAGLSLVRVAVGDRYVVERMRAEGLNLGGEQSGHVILLDHGTTGDGLVTALAVGGVVARSGRQLSELAACMTTFPQRLKSLEVARRLPLESLADVQGVIREVEATLAGEGRVLVRYSGTQNLVRVMVEGPDQAGVERAVDRITAALALALG